MGKVRYFKMITDKRYFDIHERAKNNLMPADCISYEEVKMGHAIEWICKKCKHVWWKHYPICRTPYCPKCYSAEVKPK